MGKPALATADRQLIKSGPGEELLDVVARHAASRVRIIEVLNRGSAAGAVLDVEVSAADVGRFAECVGQNRTEPVREALLYLRLECVVVRVPGALRVSDVSVDPRHGAQRVYDGRRSAVRRGLPRRIGETRVRKPSVRA